MCAARAVIATATAGCCCRHPRNGGTTGSRSLADYIVALWGCRACRSGGLRLNSPPSEQA